MLLLLLICTLGPGSLHHLPAVFSHSSSDALPYQPLVSAIVTDPRADRIDLRLNYSSPSEDSKPQFICAYAPPPSTFAIVFDKSPMRFHAPLLPVNNVPQLRGNFDAYYERLRDDFVSGFAVSPLDTRSASRSVPSSFSTFVNPHDHLQQPLVPRSLPHSAATSLLSSLDFTLLSFFLAASLLLYYISSLRLSLFTDICNHSVPRATLTSPAALDALNTFTFYLIYSSLIAMTSVLSWGPVFSSRPVQSFNPRRRSTSYIT